MLVRQILQNTKVYTSSLSIKTTFNVFLLPTSLLCTRFLHEFGPFWETW